MSVAAMQSLGVSHVLCFGCAMYSDNGRAVVFNIGYMYVCSVNNVYGEMIHMDKLMLY